MRLTESMSVVDFFESMPLSYDITGFALDGTSTGVSW